MRSLLTLALLALPLLAQPKVPANLNAVEKLSRMSPAQRKRALERMAPERREKLERGLENLNKMPPPQRQKLDKALEAFQSLPPDKKRAARAVFQDINRLPDDRRPAVRGAILNLQHLSPEEREKRYASRPFQSRFSEEEQALIKRGVVNLPTSETAEATPPPPASQPH